MATFSSFKGKFKRIRSKEKNSAVYRAVLKDQDDKSITMRTFIHINLKSRLGKIAWDSNDNKKFDNDDLIIAYKFGAIPEGKRAVKLWKKYKKGCADIVDQVKTYGTETWSDEHPTFFRFTQPKKLIDKYSTEQWAALENLPYETLSDQYRSLV